MDSSQLQTNLFFIYFFVFVLFTLGVNAQKFEQIDNLLPSPNIYRTAKGTPGKSYFQQKVDYKIQVILDAKQEKIMGEETITYHNNSPHRLNYLWVQLDQNIRKKGSFSELSELSNIALSNQISSKTLKTKIAKDFKKEYGYKIESVQDIHGKGLPYLINETMMRVDLEESLEPKGQTSFKIKWSYYIYDRMEISGRGGYEYFPNTDDYIYTIAQWYPRMAVYDDVEGWQNKQFMGQGEFALEFGDFEVEITVPEMYTVAATGVLKNPKKVLTKKQYAKFLSAKNSFIHPVVIIPQREVKSKERKSHSASWKTWEFVAKNVRDFSFAASRKFIWDGMAVKIDANTTAMAYSFYPKEGNPLWERESTLAVKKTLELYSKRTIPYPYPQATSVHSANQGMEYPMICYNFGRPNKKGKYDSRVRDGMISVIIHEVGHNFFPMIVNSDERQWSWMDEGLNSFLEKETKRVKYAGDNTLDLEWGTPLAVREYMKLPISETRPIMVNSENIPYFGYNAYGKPAAALTLLREVVMGPQLFDRAFKEYAQRWAFKRPTPADFFRTMEDVSAVDLDWFWKGWFYTVDHVDLTISEVKYYKTSTNPESPKSLSLTNSKSNLNTPILLSIDNTDEKMYGEYRSRINEKNTATNFEKYHIYDIQFENLGALPSPILIEWVYDDGTKETQNIPAEIWRQNKEQKIVHRFYKKRKVSKINLDPKQLTGDTNPNNNSYPPTEKENYFEK